MGCCFPGGRCHCLKLCSDVISHVVKFLFLVVSFVLMWESLGHPICPVVWSSAQWDTPARHLFHHFLAQPAPKLWHPSVDLQFWEKLNNVFSMGQCSCNSPDLSGLLPHLFPPVDKIADEAQAKEFLSEYNRTAEEVWNAYTEASWAYNTNITDHNKEIMVWE